MIFIFSGLTPAASRKSGIGSELIFIIPLFLVHIQYLLRKVFR